MRSQKSWNARWYVSIVTVCRVLAAVTYTIVCHLQFGVTDALKGHVPVALLVIDTKIDRPKEEVRQRGMCLTNLRSQPYRFVSCFPPTLQKIIEQAVRDVREQMGSFVCLKDVGFVDALPKTRSGKVMRATIQAVANSTPFRIPATIENVAVLDGIRGVLQKLGYAEKKSVVTGK